MMFGSEKQLLFLSSKRESQLKYYTVGRSVVYGLVKVCEVLLFCLNIKIDNFTSTESGNKVGVVFMFLGFHFIFLLISFLFYEIIGL